MAVMASVAEVPDARIVGMAFTGLDLHKTFAAMREALVFDGGGGALRRQTGADAG